MSCPYKTLPLQGGFAEGACGRSSAPQCRVACRGVNPHHPPTSPPTSAQTPTRNGHSEAALTAAPVPMALQHGARQGQGRRQELSARSRRWSKKPALGVLLRPYQSARGPAELAEDVPHHIPWPAALGSGAEQLPAELQNCPPHLPGESVVMTLLFKTQRVCAFVARREVARPRQKLSLLVSGLGFSTRLDGHLPHRAQRPPRSARPALPRDEPSATTWATRQHFPRPPGSVPRERVSLPPLAAPSLPKPVHLGTGVTAQGAHGLHQLGQLLSRRRCWKRYGEVCIEAEPQWQKGSPEASNGTEERGLTGCTGGSGVAGATPLPEARLFYRDRSLRQHREQEKQHGYEQLLCKAAHLPAHQPARVTELGASSLVCRHF